MDSIVIQDLIEIVKRETPPFSAGWERQLEAHGEKWAQEIESAFSLLFPNPVLPIKAYAEFSVEAIMKQLAFASSGNYENQSEAEVSDTYQDKDYMLNQYLPGIYLTHYLWEHHYQHLSWFRRLWTDQTDSSFHDFGVGSGMYSRAAFEGGAVSGLGFDVSPYSAQFAERVVRSHGYDSYQVRITKFSDIEPSSYLPADFAICSEVLEHLDRPDDLCAIMRTMTKPGGHAYITAAINAAERDHIYLFREPEDVRSVIQSSGWIIEQELVLSGTSTSNSVVPQVMATWCRAS